MPMNFPPSQINTQTTHTHTAVKKNNNKKKKHKLQKEIYFDDPPPKKKKKKNYSHNFWHSRQCFRDNF